MKKPYDRQAQLRRDVKAPKPKVKKPGCTAMVTKGWHDYRCQRSSTTERADLQGNFHPVCKQHAVQYDKATNLRTGESHGAAFAAFWWKWK